MKRSSIFFLLLSAVSILKAQLPSLNSSNNSYVSGNNQSWRLLDTTGLNVTNVTGAGTIWNFSSIAQKTVTSIDVFSITTGTGCFPFSTVGTNGAQKDYWNITSTKQEIIGREMNSSLIYNTTNAILLFNYPINAGSFFNDTHSGSIYSSSSCSSTKGVFNGSSSVNANASGTITLPGGSIYNDVLKLHTSMTTTFNYTCPVYCYSITESSATQSWYHSSQRYPLMSIRSTTTTTVTSTSTISSTVKTGSLSAGVPTDIHGAQVAEARFNISPNPVSGSGVLNFINNETAFFEFEILNITGQKVMALEIGELDPGMHNYSLDLNPFAGGLYFFRLKTNAWQNTQKVIIGSK